MKVKLVCRRKQLGFKMISKWVADKVMNQRKIWQNRIHPTLTQERGKESYLREWCRGGGRGKRAVLLGQLYRDRLQRENKLDTGEDRTSQRMRRSQKIRAEWHGQYEAKQSTSVGHQENPDWISLQGKEFEPELRKNKSEVSGFSSKSQRLKTF